MLSKRFISGFLMCSVASLAGIILSQEYLLKDDHLSFLLISFAYFIASCVLVHIFAKRASKSDNKYSFSRVTLLNTFSKLVVLMLLVVVYRLTFPEKSIDFVWPFLGCYILFTIFETRFLMKLAKS